MEINENGYSGRKYAGNSDGCPGTGPITGPNGTGGTNGNGGMNGSNGINNENHNCDGGFGTENHQLAMVYTPYQCWRMLYPPTKALTNGTLFEELYKPLTECDYERQ